MLKAVIFDFDGVIADSEPLHLKTFNMALKPLGVEIPRDKYYSDYLGYNDIECLHAVSGDFGLDLSARQIDELVRQKSEFFDDLAGSDSAIIQGVPEFIGMLAENGIAMAVCSGALLSDIEQMLDGTGLKDAFEVIVAADHVSRGKPDPEGFTLAVKRMNEQKPSREPILPSQCVVIEDSHWGLQAASAASMRCVAVANTYPADQLTSYADIVVENLTEITITVLKGLCQ